MCLRLFFGSNSFHFWDLRSPLIGLFLLWCSQLLHDTYIFTDFARDHFSCDLLITKRPLDIPADSLLTWDVSGMVAYSAVTNMLVCLVNSVNDINVVTSSKRFCIRPFLGQQPPTKKGILDERERPEFRSVPKLGWRNIPCILSSGLHGTFWYVVILIRVKAYTAI